MRAAEFPERRFPPPWSVEELDAFVVKDSAGQTLAHVYFENESGRRSAVKSELLRRPADLKCVI